MNQIVIATENKNKLNELKTVLGGAGHSFLSLADFPALKLPPETGKTFEENAIIKARYVAKHTGLWSLADDSGLIVKALNGQPGVHSARYAGPEKNYTNNNLKLLNELKNINNRAAYFETVIALCGPQGETFCSSGKLHGKIAKQMLGENGFGYDSVFIAGNCDKTLAQITAKEKNAVSHRSKAINALLAQIEKII